VQAVYAAPIPTTDDRLSLTLFFAIVAHAILVLSVGFAPTDKSRFESNTLDIVLVQKRAEQDPDDAEYLAQASQEGGGESTEKARPATPLPAPFAARNPAVTAAAPPVPQAPETPTPRPTPEAREPTPSKAAPKPVLAQTKQASEHKATSQPAARDQPKTTRPDKQASSVAAESRPSKPVNAAALVTRSLAMASLSAELDQRMSAYAKRPKRKWISARTKELKYAAYMEAWRTKVERIGNLNYPDEARLRRLSGNLLLEVSLKPDGSINDIVLRRSSGHKVLDDAAVRIVKLAAPFAPLPKSIRKDVDILHIQRTWQFLRSNRLASR
jgi:periplasmic protein TonB